MKVREKNKYYTFMVVPHDAAGHTLCLRIPSFLVKGLLIFLIAAVSVFSLSLIYSAVLSGKLLHYKFVLQSNAEKDKNIEKFATETDAIRQELQAVLDQNNSLRKVLGLKIEKIKITPKSSLDQIKGVKLSLNELKTRVNYLQTRMASMPTAWPIYGRIMSGYGYRRSPWRGMHTGVDINAYYGAPVRATAAGTVAETGWKTGYGKSVVVEHGFGISTLYAHNSRMAVVAGQKVRKGQVIAYVGMTGYSTGPHCHYEVRKNGYAVNPIPYLGMNILTASRYL